MTLTRGAGGLAAEIGVRLGGLELDVELHVEPGQVMAILGPNGAGKSTVLRALSGLLPIDRGRITIGTPDGELVVDDPAANRFVPPDQRPVAVVFQDYLLFAHLSALENVAFGLRARGTPRAEARSRAAEWLERMGLADHAHHRPRQLSGGQAQRVALARALATHPSLLLLDEPLAALDAGARSDVRRDLRRHLESFDGTRILVTHDPVDAYALADRVAIMDSGRVVQTGTLSEVTAHPRSRYVADLVGINLVSGTVHEGVLTTESGAHVVIADALAGPTFAVVRPQAVSLQRESVATSSVRNIWPGTVADIDRLGDRCRVSLHGPLPLTAEITVAALESLALRPGDEIFAAVKATDIVAYPA
jgi:molybdate transport system ATP-binding protein